MIQNNDFSLPIQFWYRQNARKLPWRTTSSAYKIWLSEIILQQTRVDQGMNYYHAFCNLFPTIHDLANASEQQVLSTWQGLGYYSRARNLHKAAQIIVNEYNGEFPNTYESLLKLPGVGPYTAAAIASFAFDLPHAVVDGNVYRLLSRYFDIDLPIDSGEGKKYFEALAKSVLDEKQPAIHNQAMMEMGALVCTPHQPNCEICPLNESCLGLKNKTLLSLPVKSKKVKVRQRYFHYLVAMDEDKILLQKRTEKDIWQNMYEFPLVEVLEKDALVNFLEKSDMKIGEPIAEYNHVLTHQKINAQFHKVTSPLEKLNIPKTEWIKRKNLNEYPLPRLIDRFLLEQD